ncbi:MbnP family copper-binding protein [Gaopeijia maritima]|uniref:MbnP family copper-binding protein n=1 Tax=Gaopeijia maritima TaxID=3119007 RepID=UPI003249EEA6
MLNIIRTTRGVALGAALLTVAACEDDPVEPAMPIEVTLDFAAVVDEAAFSCGNSYDNVGTSNTTITPVDFRFYVHDVELIAADGSSVELELTQDGTWQRDNVVLLDFENGSGPCVNGTAAMNTTVRGTAPDATYTGVRFTLGVPEELNHADQTTAAAPLDLTSLFWSWNGGYKFLRIDHTSDAQPEGWFVHLGSTGCTPTGDPTVPATSCSNEHRPTFEFLDFDLGIDEIVADYGALLANSDLAQNSGAKGCMSFPGDPECAVVMNAFGLAYEGSQPSGQSFFSIR